jgi:hypothetical protein
MDFPLWPWPIPYLVMMLQSARFWRTRSSLILAIVIRLLADIADGVNSPSTSTKQAVV